MNYTVNVKAENLRPGMTVCGTKDRTKVSGTISAVMVMGPLVLVNNNKNHSYTMKSSELVRVEKDVYCPSPVEPRGFGDRVTVGGNTAVRVYDATDEFDPDNPPWRVRLGRDCWRDVTWSALCTMGEVEMDAPGSDR